LSDIMTLKSGLEVTQDHSNRNIKHRDFFIDPLHSIPPLGGSPSEYYHPVWYGKTRVVVLPDSEKTLRICITF